MSRDSTPPRAPGPPGHGGPRSLAARLVAVGFVQLGLLVGFAVLIGLLTLPTRAGPADSRSSPHEPRSSRPGDGGPPRHPDHSGRVPVPDGVPLESPLVGWGLTLLAGALVIGTGSLMTARWIAMPIAQLAQAVRAVGDGDLRVRTQVQRGDEIGDLARAFDDMVSRVALLLEAERELLANVSHELRTPLARIRVASDLATEGDHAAARMALAEITTDLAELELIVDNVLVAARLDALARVHPVHLVSGARERVSVREVLSSARDRFQALHPSYRVDLGGVDGVVTADPVLLRRVFDNLLDNGRKYGAVAPGPLELDITATADSLVCGVRDFGPGISADDMARVFEPFFRAERSRSRDGGGVGLGLTLVKRIVHSHGGSVHMESGPFRGTRVVVTLPRA